MPTPTFVLVPGAGGDAGYWHLVQERLASRGIHSVAVSLPGPDPGAGLSAYVDLVARTAGRFDDVVIVGQSLGGFTASWAADVVRPHSLVLLNAMIPAPGESAGQWWEATGWMVARRAHDELAGRDPDGDTGPEVHFLHDVPAEALAQLGEPQDESGAVFGEPWGPARWPDVPTRVLAGADDRFFPLTFQRDVARQRLGLDVEVVPGGHLPALSRPDELVEALLHTI